MMSGNGLSRARNLGDGADWAGKVKAIIQFCLAMETRGLARHLSGNKD